MLRISVVARSSEFLSLKRISNHLRSSSSFITLPKENKDQVPIKAWIRNVPVEEDAQGQLQAIAKLPIVYSHVAAMPDVHIGKGACVGCVVPTINAIIPAAVGVDIGCGMMAVKTSLHANQLPDSLKSLRSAVECAIPHGRTNHGKTGDIGSWKMNRIPEIVKKEWTQISKDYEYICTKQPSAKAKSNVNHLGTLGTGNHFIEMCLDEWDSVWFMLHSGSRGPGNRIGSVYIELAKEDMIKIDKTAKVDKNLSYLKEGMQNFKNYVFAVSWAQKYAKLNRQIMMTHLIDAARRCPDMPSFSVDLQNAAVNCHHNYVNVETHFGQEVYLTRKGAVSARKNELGIIPGSMGAKSYIVRGRGNPDSFHSCSHGAGRVMSRTKAKKTFTIQDHIQATQGVECRKDSSVIDETPMAYKDIDQVMAAQSDLVDVVHTLKQVLCVKG